MSTIKLFTVLMVLILSTATSLVMAYENIPEQVTINVMAKYFEGVEFDHDLHNDLGKDCSVCHHHTTGTGTTAERCMRCHADDDETAQVACSDCHVVDPFSAQHINRQVVDIYQFHSDKPGLKAAYHWKCLSCHEETEGPTGCEDCHARTSEGDVFYHASSSAENSVLESH